MQRGVTSFAAAFLLALFASEDLRAQHIPETVTRDVLRVCADPANMPFSNRQGEGFENRIAEIVASELKVPLRYYWLPQGPGFIRNTLQTGLCDLVLGYASGADIVQHTNPYYRSTYVLVVKKGGALDGVKSLDDPRLKDKRLGVTAATPPADYLLAQGLMANARTYALLVDRRYAAPADEMIADLAAGKIDGALLWGPIGGYLAKKAGNTLEAVPLLEEKNGPPLTYRITFGIRHSEIEWKHRLEGVIRKRQGDINKVLQDYGVPLLDEDNRLIKARADTPGRTALASVVPEPDNYRMDDYRAPTPATLRHATVLQTAEARALWKADAAIFVDVMPRPPKPANLPAGTLWRDPPHDTVPKAIWLVNTGFGALDPDAEAYFRHGLSTATGNDRSKPLVFFCQRNCWMSWNAAKRALAYGYANVSWFPDGTDGWAEAGLPLERAEPAP